MRNESILTAPKRGSGKRFNFATEESHTVFYHEQGAETLLVGAEEKLYHLDFNSSAGLVVEFKAENYGNCKGQVNCKNHLMVIDKFNEKLLVCGTNAYQPTCWHLTQQTKNKTQYGPGFSPFVPDQNFLILFSGGEAFSTINKFRNNGKILRFHRISGKDTNLYTNDHLMEKPQFVKVTVIEQEESYKNKIYYFFREENQQKNLDADFTISRVAQLCKEDGGGEGSFAASMWTTFLKARLVCGYLSQKKFFNKLHDVFIVKSENWTETRVYGVFSNHWNFTAVCMYSIGNIERTFRTSPLKGNNKPLPSPRPGECLIGGQPTPTETFNMADSHPELENEVMPIRNEPLFHSHIHYTKIVVDQVTTTNRDYNVLFLATENGMIHKVVELDHEAVNILEIQPFQTQAPIQSMTLDSNMKRLYVGSSTEVVQVPLDMCEVYKDSCENCFLARDPYCGWHKQKCSSSLHYAVLQNIAHGSPEGKCDEVRRTLQLVSGRPPRDDSAISVPPFSRYFISCPVTSHHATYSWTQDDVTKLSCPSNEKTCFYHINNMTDEQYGKYACIAREGEVSQVVAEYMLLKAHGSVMLPYRWLVVLQIAALYLLLK
ncbi:semaphorin-7A isoform X2 [Rhinatrema bivittatum]|uniref:semaphorin-7A isoform X2 n=1 Tax=Rhinatrema bivittatum TaxID=194408 RepID=UPI001128E61C|nr:semaphorin-7A isoform X2 [Rhinatrema bivittatum]